MSILKRKIKKNRFWNKTIKIRFLKLLIFCLLIVPLVTCIGFIIWNAVMYGNIVKFFKQDFSFFNENKKSIQITLLSFNILFVPIISYFLSFVSYFFKKGVEEETVKISEENILGENAEFLIDDREICVTTTDPDWVAPVKTHSKLNISRLNESYPTGSYEAGFIVRSQWNSSKKELTYSIGKEKHMALFGIPGSAKSQITIIPNIIYSGMVKEVDGETNNDRKKPIIIVNDPKGELFEKTAAILENSGYEIKCLNFKDFEKSSYWNPLSIPYQLFKKGLNFSKEGNGWVKKNTVGGLMAFKNRTKKIKCYKHQKKICEDCTKNAFDHYGELEYLPIAYPNSIKQIYFTNDRDLESYVLSQCKLYKQKAYDAISELAYVICPDDPKGGDKHWTENPRLILEGLLLIFLDMVDAEKNDNPEVQAISEEIFNFGNIKLILSKKEYLLDWFKKYQEKFGHEERQSINKLATPLSLESNIDTFLNTISQKLSIWDSSLLNDITSYDDFNWEEIVKKPTAIFIIMPDKDKKYNFMTSLFVRSSYQKLVDISIDYGDQLPRNVHYIIDEFGVCPMIPDFADMLAVSRSRKIFFLIAMQGRWQLVEKYSDNGANMILDNIHLQCFAQISDINLIKSIEERAGEYSQSVAGHDDLNNVTSSSWQRVKLIPKEAVANLKKGLLIVISSAAKPMFAGNIPFFLGASKKEFQKANGQQFYDKSLSTSKESFQNQRFSVKINKLTNEKVETFLNWENSCKLQILSAVEPENIKISPLEFNKEINVDVSFDEDITIDDLLYSEDNINVTLEITDDDLPGEVNKESVLDINPQNKYFDNDPDLKNKVEMMKELVAKGENKNSEERFKMYNLMNEIGKEIKSKK
ncbi:type IV secretion system protein VirD4 (plasmid) [Spiroplasma corruscae]|uniref:Type IV secretion system protein VirD4 n=1 Tax=Spiroplasma corruscae TaxID=216934 RepID=A0A222EQK0_9MOLU|nr:type IV secretory system conjugative DNA transfer family protein [Spiroplasma corruscae]ASP28797.1 type IV secretion system protein VirD4 [Spiroplasma corruscae]